MPLDIVSALGPGKQLSNLNKFTFSYKTATTNFTNLLRYPFLQSIVLGEGEQNNQDLRAIVVDGSSRFQQLCTTNISIAEQVNSFGQIVATLLESSTIGAYAADIQPVVSEYAAEAAKNSKDNKEFFEEFETYLRLLDKQIELMEGNIATLTGKIRDAGAELKDANVGRVIGDLIKSFFKIATGDEGDVQLATLLNVGIETMKSSFAQIWEDRKRLTELLKGLTLLKDNLTAIKKLFSALSVALVGVISDTKSLLFLWADVGDRLARVQNVDRKVTSPELKQVVDDWTKAQEAATAYVKAILEPGSAIVSVMSGGTSVEVASHKDQVPKVPRTKGEIKMALLLSTLKFQMNEVSHSSISAALDSNPNVSDSDKDELLKLAGPPPNTQDVLNDIAQKTSGIMKQFNTLLQIPYLNQLQCNNPDKPLEKINIHKMVTDYQKMYWDLQQETIPVVQNLQSYSEEVLALLPLLVTTPSTESGQVTVEMYLDANQSLAIDYKRSADDLRNKSLSTQKLWINAINTVVQAINECKLNIETWEKNIADLTEEVKRLTFQSLLEGLGALACFAAAAFIPGGLLASLAFLGKTIYDLIQIGQLTAAINETKDKIGVARSTEKNLESLLPLMQTIADGLASITKVWEEISQALNNVLGWNRVLRRNPNLLQASRPKLIEDWKAIRDATKEYINIITGQNK